MPPPDDGLAKDSRRAPTDVPKVAGSIALDQLKVAEELLGKVVVTRALARMTPPAQAEFSSLTREAWCSIHTTREFHEVTARAAGQDVHVWHRRLVRIGMERTFTAWWRLLMRLTSVHSLVKRAAETYPKSYDRGVLHVEVVDDKRVHAELREWPDVPDFEIDALLAGLDAMLRLSGRTRWNVRHERRGGIVWFELQLKD